MIQQRISWPQRGQSRSRCTTKTVVHWSHQLLSQGATLEDCPGYWGFTLPCYKTEILTPEKTELTTTMLWFLHPQYFIQQQQSAEKSTFQDLLLILSCGIHILKVSKEMAWHKPTVRPMGNFVRKVRQEKRISWECTRSTWLTHLSVILLQRQDNSLRKIKI